MFNMSFISHFTTPLSPCVASYCLNKLHKNICLSLPSCIKSGWKDVCNNIEYLWVSWTKWRIFKLPNMSAYSRNFSLFSKTCFPNAFRSNLITTFFKQAPEQAWKMLSARCASQFCGIFCPDEARSGLRQPNSGEIYRKGGGEQIAEMIFQTCSRKFNHKQFPKTRVRSSQYGKSFRNY